MVLILLPWQQGLARPGLSTHPVALTTGHTGPRKDQSEVFQGSSLKAQRKKYQMLLYLIPSKHTILLIFKIFHQMIIFSDFFKLKQIIASIFVFMSAEIFANFLLVQRNIPLKKKQGRNKKLNGENRLQESEPEHRGPAPENGAGGSHERQALLRQSLSKRALCYLLTSVYFHITIAKHHRMILGCTLTLSTQF